MANWSVEVENLTRVFGDFIAVDHVSFRVREGQIFGFLGPNGAGKSTTIRMLTGILTPTSGSGRVAGFDIRSERQQIKQAIGYMSQRFSLYEDLSARENLQFFGGIYGAADLDWAIRVCHLEPVLDLLCASLSVGLRQRVALACAVVHRPRIVFLDEPTAGVDPGYRRSFWELIYALTQEGVTVFVSTHYMDEAEHCNWLAMIDAGKIVAAGSPAMLRQSAASGSAAASSAIPSPELPSTGADLWSVKPSRPQPAIRTSMPSRIPPIVRRSR